MGEYTKIMETLLNQEIKAINLSATKNGKALQGTAPSLSSSSFSFTLNCSCFISHYRIVIVDGQVRTITYPSAVLDVRTVLEVVKAKFPNVDVHHVCNFEGVISL